MLKTVKTVLHILFKTRKRKQNKITPFFLWFDCFNNLHLNQQFSLLAAALLLSRYLTQIKKGVSEDSFSRMDCIPDLFAPFSAAKSIIPYMPGQCSSMDKGNKRAYALWEKGVSFAHSLLFHWI